MTKKIITIILLFIMGVRPFPNDSISQGLTPSAAFCLRPMATKNRESSAETSLERQEESLCPFFIEREIGSFLKSMVAIETMAYVGGSEIFNGHALGGFEHILKAIRSYKEIDLTPYGITGIFNLSEVLKDKSIILVKERNDKDNSANADFFIDRNGNIFVEFDVYKSLLWCSEPDLFVYGILRQILPYELKRLGIKRGVIEKVLTGNFRKSAVADGVLLTKLDDDLYLRRTERYDTRHSDEKVAIILTARSSALKSESQALIEKLGGLQTIKAMPMPTFLKKLNEIYKIREITHAQIQSFIDALQSAGWSVQDIMRDGMFTTEETNLFSFFNDTVIESLEHRYGRRAVEALGITRGDRIVFIREYLEHRGGLYKAGFFHEALENIAVEKDLEDPLCRIVSRHANIAVIEETLRFAYCMGELELTAESLGVNETAYGPASERMRNAIMNLLQTARRGKLPKSCQIIEPVQIKSDPACVNYKIIAAIESAALRPMAEKISIKKLERDMGGLTNYLREQEKIKIFPSAHSIHCNKEGKIEIREASTYDLSKWKNAVTLNVSRIWGAVDEDSNVFAQFRDFRKKANQTITWADLQGSNTLICYNFPIWNGRDSDIAWIICEEFIRMKNAGYISHIDNITVLLTYDAVDFYMYWSRKMAKTDSPILVIPPNLKGGDIIKIHSPFGYYQRAVLLSKSTSTKPGFTLLPIHYWADSGIGFLQSKEYLEHGYRTETVRSSQEELSLLGLRIEKEPIQTGEWDIKIGEKYSGVIYKGKSYNVTVVGIVHRAYILVRDSPTVGDDLGGYALYHSISKAHEMLRYKIEEWNTPTDASRAVQETVPVSIEKVSPEVIAAIQGAA